MTPAAQWDDLQQRLAAFGQPTDEELLAIWKECEGRRVADARGGNLAAGEVDEQVRKAQANINERVNGLWSVYTEVADDPERLDLENLDTRIALLERILRLDPNHVQAASARGILQQRRADEEAFLGKRRRIFDLREAVQHGEVAGPTADEVDRLYAEARSAVFRRRIEEDADLKAAWDIIVEWRNTREGSERYSRFLGNMKETYEETLNLSEEEWPRGERRPFGSHGALTRGETLRVMAEEWGGHVTARIERDIALSRNIGDPTTRLATLNAALGHYTEWSDTTLAQPDARLRELHEELLREIRAAENQERAWRRHRTAIARADRLGTPLERYDGYCTAKDDWLAAGGQSYPSLEEKLQRAAAELADDLARQVDPYLTELATRIQDAVDREALDEVRRKHDEFRDRVNSRPVDSPALSRVKQRLNDLSRALAVREGLVGALERIGQALEAENANLEELKQELQRLEQQYRCSLKRWHNRVAQREGLDAQVRVATSHLDRDGDYENCLAALEGADDRDPRVLRLKQRAWMQRGLSLLGKRATWASARNDLQRAATSDEDAVRTRAQQALQDLGRLEEQQRPIDEVVAKVRGQLGMAGGAAPQGGNRQFSQALESLRQALSTQQGYLDEARMLHQVVLVAWQDGLRTLLKEWLDHESEQKAEAVRDALDHIRRDPELLATDSADRNLVRRAKLRFQRFSAMQTPPPAAKEERARRIADIEQLIKEDPASLDDFDLLEWLVRLCILDEQFDRGRGHLVKLEQCVTAKAYTEEGNTQELQRRLGAVQGLLSMSEKSRALLDAYCRQRQGQIDDDWLTRHAGDCLDLLEGLPRDDTPALHHSFLRHVKDLSMSIADRIQAAAQAPQIGTFRLLSLLRRAVGALGPLVENDWVGGMTARLSALERRVAPRQQDFVPIWLTELAAYQETCRNGAEIEWAQHQCRQFLSDADALGDHPEVQRSLQWLQDIRVLLDACHRNLGEFQRAYEGARQGGRLDRDGNSAFKACRQLISRMQALETDFNTRHPRSTIRLAEWRRWGERLDNDLGARVLEAELPYEWPRSAEEWRGLQVQVVTTGEVSHYDHLREGYSQVLMSWVLGNRDAFVAGAQKMGELDPDDRYSFARRFAIEVSEWPGEAGLAEATRRRCEGLGTALQYVQTRIIPNLQEWQRRKARVEEALRLEFEPDDVSTSLEERLAAAMKRCEDLRRLYGFAYPKELEAHIARILMQLHRQYGLDDPRLKGLAELDGGSEDELVSLPPEEQKRESISEAFRILVQSLDPPERRPDCLSFEARKISDELYTAGGGGEEGGGRALRARAQETFNSSVQAVHDLLDRIESKWRIFRDFDATPQRPAATYRQRVKAFREQLEELDLGDPAAREIIEMELPLSWSDRLGRWIGRLTGRPAEE